MSKPADAGIDRKIVDALEKVSQALRTLAWRKSVEQDISPIQLQILIFLSNHREHRAQVSVIAREFNISIASISDTVKTLETKKLIEKVYKALSSRQFVIRLTAEGLLKATASSRYDEEIFIGIGHLSANEKGQFFALLSQLILSLNEAEVITQQRMCLTCKHYQTRESKHFCNLLQAYMGHLELQIDCDDHLIKR